VAYIEKAFLVHAAPQVIYDRLQVDLGEGEAAAYTLLESAPPRLLAIQLKLSGIECRLTYVIKPLPGGGCEVSVSLDPLGAKYRLYQALTFGHLKTNFELMLAQGLLNLKQAVE
jgi:hypothetical protein